MYFQAKKYFKNQLLLHLQTPSIFSVHVVAHAKDFFAFTLYYNGYDDLMDLWYCDNSCFSK
jgi:hypothetical protein